MKILKEKLIEDESSSGMGNLFDDDKTSHQHIDLLKSKYSTMKQEACKKEEKQKSEKLAVKGEELMLTSKFNVLKKQLTEIQQQKLDFNESMSIIKKQKLKT